MENIHTNGSVMVAGHICLDVTPVFKTAVVSGLSEIMAPGKLIHVDNADIHTGGAVSNTGLAMKKLGMPVKLVAKVGNDSFGHVVRDKLNEYGSGNDLVMDSTVSTSYSVVVAIPGIDRIFLHHPGANDSFVSSDITDKMLEGIRHFHFGYPPLMRRMYERDGTELIDLFRRVKEQGITTSLDMAAVDPNSPAGKVDWANLLARVLPFVDVFVPSVEELGFMLDRRLYEQWNTRASGGDITDILEVEQDIEPLANQLMTMGARVVLIKCGAAGMMYKTALADVMHDLIKAHSLSADGWCGKAGFEESYQAPEILSGTGAGDTSIAAFLTALLKGADLDKCVKVAAATGACCMSSYDALGGLRPLDELWEKIGKGWKKREPAK